jgi:NADPH-dependent curcumin reductase
VQLLLHSITTKVTRVSIRNISRHLIIMSGSKSGGNFEIPAEGLEVYLAARPDGMVKPETDFATRKVAVPRPDDIDDDSVLVRVLWVSCDPTMRGWMADAPSYLPPVELGAVMRAGVVGEVVGGTGLKFGALVYVDYHLSLRSFRVEYMAMRHSTVINHACILHSAPLRLRYRSTGLLGWREYVVAKVSEVTPVNIPEELSPSIALGVLGMTGMTAYFGLLDVGKAKKGDVIVVSSAAGATGSVVAQIAKHVLGCFTVGIAGGPDKCRYLTEELGLDAAVKYVILSRPLQNLLAYANLTSAL